MTSPKGESGPPPGVPGERRRVVIFVNDDPEVDEQVRTTLERVGYTVHLVGNAQEALRVIQGEPRVDLLLFNIEIAVAEGIDELMLLKNMHPTLPVVPACPIRHGNHPRRAAGEATAR